MSPNFIVNDPHAPAPWVEESNPILSDVKFKESSSRWMEFTDLFLLGGFLGVLKEDDLENKGMVRLFSSCSRFCNLYCSLKSNQCIDCVCRGNFIRGVWTIGRWHDNNYSAGAKYESPAQSAVVLLYTTNRQARQEGLVLGVTWPFVQKLLKGFLSFVFVDLRLIVTSVIFLVWK